MTMLPGGGFYRGLLEVPEYQEYAAGKERKRKEARAAEIENYERKMQSTYGPEYYRGMSGQTDPLVGMLLGGERPDSPPVAPADFWPGSAAVKAGVTKGLGLLSTIPAALWWNQARKRPVQPGTLSHLTSHGTPNTWPPEPGYPEGRPRLGAATGQGAAMYGKGLYVAEADGVAREMFDQLSDQHPRIIRSEAGEMELTPWRVGQLEGNPDAVTALGDEMQRNLDDITSRIFKPKNEFDVSYRPELEKNYLRQLKKLEDYKQVTGYGTDDLLKLEFPRKGGVYRLDIPDEVVPDLLDLDKGLDQQLPAVQERLNKVLKEFDPYDISKWPQESPETWALAASSSTAPVQTGTYYKALRLAIGDDEAARLLEEVGIPGVKYLDAGSRAAGEGTRNFAIFAEDVLKRIKVLGLDQ